MPKYEKRILTPYEKELQKRAEKAAGNKFLLSLIMEDRGMSVGSRVTHQTPIKGVLTSGVIVGEQVENGFVPVLYDGHTSHELNDPAMLVIEQGE